LTPQSPCAQENLPDAIRVSSAYYSEEEEQLSQLHSQENISENIIDF